MEHAARPYPKFPTPQQQHTQTHKRKRKAKGMFGIIAVFRSGRDASRVGLLFFLPPRPCIALAPSGTVQSCMHYDIPGAHTYVYPNLICVHFRPSSVYMKQNTANQSQDATMHNLLQVLSRECIDRIVCMLVYMSDIDYSMFKKKYFLRPEKLVSILSFN